MLSISHASMLRSMRPTGPVSHSWIIYQLKWFTISQLSICFLIYWYHDRNWSVNNKTKLFTEPYHTTIQTWNKILFKSGDFQLSLMCFKTITVNDNTSIALALLQNLGCLYGRRDGTFARTGRFSSHVCMRIVSTHWRMISPGMICKLSIISSRQSGSGTTLSRFCRDPGWANRNPALPGRDEKRPSKCSFHINGTW